MKVNRAAIPTSVPTSVTPSHKAGGTGPVPHLPPTACYRWEAGDLILSVKVHPRSGKFQIGKVTGTHLQVKVAAPPEKGRATEELLAGLADALGVRPGAVSLMQGAFTTRKVVRIIAPQKLPPVITPCPPAGRR